jgi:hypothetical protein
LNCYGTATRELAFIVVMTPGQIGATNAGRWLKPCQAASVVIEAVGLDALSVVGVDVSARLGAAGTAHVWTPRRGDELITLADEDRSFQRRRLDPLARAVIAGLRSSREPPQRA